MPNKDGFKLSKKCGKGHRLWARKGLIVCDACEVSIPSPARARRRANGQQS